MQILNPTCTIRSITVSMNINRTLNLKKLAISLNGILDKQRLRISFQNGDHGSITKNGTVKAIGAKSTIDALTNLHYVLKKIEKAKVIQ